MGLHASCLAFTSLLPVLFHTPLACTRPTRFLPALVLHASCLHSSYTLPACTLRDPILPSQPRLFILYRFLSSSRHLSPPPSLHSLLCQEALPFAVVGRNYEQREDGHLRMFRRTRCGTVDGVWQCLTGRDGPDGGCGTFEPHLFFAYVCTRLPCSGKPQPLRLFQSARPFVAVRGIGALPLPLKAARASAVESRSGLCR